MIFTISEHMRFVDEDESIRLTDFAFDLPTQRKFKDSGAMVAPATLARVGIMEYSAGQLGNLFADKPKGEVIKVMTRAEDLFHEDAIESARSAPITIGHPDVDVSVKNADYLQKGNLDGVPFKDEDGVHLSGHIILTHEESLNLVDAGVDQLSSGHDARLVRLSDEEAEELGYHAYKTNIRHNHIAIVPRGRAGSARIKDEKEEPNEEVKMYDQEHVSGLEARLDAAVTLADSLKAKLTEAEAKLTDEHIQSLVDKRLVFLQNVAQFTEQDVSKMSEIDAMQVALKDTLGKDYVDRDASFIRTRYQILVEEGVPQEQATDISQALHDHALNSSKPEQMAKSPSQEARERMIARATK